MASAAAPAATGNGAKQELCLVRNNPWSKVNNSIKDPKRAFYYKRSMNIGSIVIITCVVGLVGVGGFFNIPGFFHALPVLLPCCALSLPPLYWAFISVLSIGGSAVSIVTGIIFGSALTGFIINMIIICLELLSIYTLTKIDPELRPKLNQCMGECGCCKSDKAFRDPENPDAERPYVADQGEKEFEAAIGEKFSTVEKNLTNKVAEKIAKTAVTQVEQKTAAEVDKLTKTETSAQHRSRENGSFNDMYSKAALGLNSALDSFNRILENPKEKKPAKGLADLSPAPSERRLKPAKPQAPEFLGENEGNNKVRLKRENHASISSTLKRQQNQLGSTLRGKFQHKSKVQDSV